MGIQLHHRHLASAGRRDKSGLAQRGALVHGDRKVNGTDFVLLANNFNQFASQSAVSAADWTALQDFATANGISLSSVPEPISAGMMVMAGLSVLARRRLRFA